MTDFLMQIYGGEPGEYDSLNRIFALDSYHWARAECVCWPGRQYGDPPSDYCTSKLHHERIPPRD